MRITKKPTLHRTPKANNKQTLAYWPRYANNLPLTLQQTTFNLGLWPRYANNKPTFNFQLSTYP
ncbi:MAG: hypothetical protein F6J98_06605 [Moorea sp. SIO4G2]|uniref:Uncharacterized protein n=1 Tax=Moorena bouillonii PNG TaxID=568701 RepID=A0A1U7MWI7_9CYAN|nr:MULTISPECIES: hypothetical protein [Moorena]NEO48703.1 hypothetical protein [Moorena sp. SIO4A3]NEO60110.1 hypothetical protein [Moorena sp. SIO4G2]NEO12854.1 hypothetical protein [Moorena sp. SIO3E8]NEP26691.1 hypothetical protein [Moorena sp. SIO3I6]NEQ01631.1 hypothetical protein [Moorena sp. SIO3F7]